MTDYGKSTKNVITKNKLLIALFALIKLIIREISTLSI